MKQKEIERMLREWFAEMLKKYDWLSFKFEFSEKRNVFMVSYYPIDKMGTDDFCRDSMAFEDKINLLYGNDAPLFCDAESLFVLSKYAETVSSNTFRSICNDANIHWDIESYESVYINNTLYNNLLIAA